MNDISSQDQNQSHFKVPKEDLTNYQSQHRNIANQNSKPESTDSSASLNAKINEDPVNIIKTNPVSRKTGDISNDIGSSSPNQPRIDHNSLAPEIKAQSLGQPDIKSLIVLIAKYVLISILGITLFFCLMNWSAISLRFNYWWVSSIKKENWAELHPIKLLQAQNTAQKLDENFLYIQSLGIQSPVGWGIVEKDVKGMLSQGLVNYQAASLPDDATGNIFISGQTSAPIWSGSNSKTTFTLLNKIQPNAKIIIVYNNLIYVYRVESIKSVGSNKIVITTGNEENSYLNLLAQYPIGIGWKTLVVRAKLSDILDNVATSIDDKVKETTVNDNTDIAPIKITPTTTTVPYPTSDYNPDDPLPTEVFLPGV